MPGVLQKYIFVELLYCDLGVGKIQDRVQG